MDESLIMEKLRALRERFKKALMLQRILLWLFHGSACTAVILVLFKLSGITVTVTPYLFYSMIPLILALVIPCITFFVQKIPLIKVALLADERLQMKERLSTVLEWIEHKKKRTLMFKGLLKDTAVNASQIKPEKTFPVTVPRLCRGFAVTVPLIIVLLLTPTWRVFALFPTPEEAQAIKTVSRQLDNLAKNLENQKTPETKSSEDIRKKARDLKKMAQDLKKPSTGRKEAIAKLSSLRDRIKDERKKSVESRSVLDRLAQASSPRSSEKDQKSLAQKLKEMAQKLKDKNVDKKTVEDIQSLLSRMNESLRDGDALKKDLEEALKSLERNDGQNASEGLEKIAQSLENMQSLGDNEPQLKNLQKELSRLNDELSGQNGEMNGSEMSDNDNSNSGNAENGDESLSQGQGKGGKSGSSGNVKETGGMEKKFQKGASNEKRPADFGVGSTNEEVKNKQQEKSPDYVLDRQKDKESNWKGIYERIYDPKREAIDSAGTTVKSQVTGTRGVTGSQELRGGIPKAERHDADDRAVYSSYKGKAEEAINREKIPKEYKSIVRNYFKEIDPSK
ncbi:MAG: hypothetical protein AB2L14_00385 [Candidatus Xenobiia bacterium LiM19]